MDNERGIIKGSSSIIFKKASGHKLALLDNDLKSLCKVPSEKISLHILAFFPVLPSVKATNMSKTGTIMVPSFPFELSERYNLCWQLFESICCIYKACTWLACVTRPCWCTPPLEASWSLLDTQQDRHQTQWTAIPVWGRDVPYRDWNGERGRKSMQRHQFRTRNTSFDTYFQRESLQVREAGVFLWQATTNIFVYVYLITDHARSYTLPFLPNAKIFVESFAIQFHTIAMFVNSLIHEILSHMP